MAHRLSWIGWIPLSAIGATITAVYVAWFAAYSHLGRRPMPSMDDPKFIGGMSTAVYNIMVWVILVSLALWSLGMITIVVIALLPRTEKRRSWFLKAVGGLAAIVLLFVLVRYSPGDACTWILD